ncbi:MAG: LTA synthase family protein [candidate division Zixibacteria bacterium]|nr:LTA synthase family protein [candidate division Zixibacteria bacterium]
MRKRINIPQHTAVWATVFIVSVLCFAILRLLFLLGHRDVASSSAISNVMHAFGLGFRFDAKVLAILFLPLYLLTLLPTVDFHEKGIRKAFAWVLTPWFGIFIFLGIADIRFFGIFGSRLNFWAVEYLEHTDLFLYSIVSDAAFWMSLVLILAMTALYYIAIRIALNRLTRRRSYPSWSSRIIWHIIVLALLAFAIRGKLGMKALDWGAAFFCEDQFANQLALNSVYTFGHSLYEEWRDGRSPTDPNKQRFAFYPIDDACDTVCDMLDIEPTGCDSLDLTRKLGEDGNLGFIPNVVIIIMESWSNDRIGVLDSDVHISPHFDSLSNHGLLFTRFYANGIRTNRGLPAIVCSFPALPGRSIMKRYSASHPFRSLAEILDTYGVTSIFAHGGDIEFDNMEGFLRAVGYDRFFGEDDFGDALRLGKWGIADHAFFERLADKIDSFPRPFNLTALSLSYHDPYLIPDERFRRFDDNSEDNRKLNSLYYTDWALGRFFDRIRNEPFVDSTIFIITADHYPHQSGTYPLAPANFKIPLFIYAPGIIGDFAQKTDVIASQVDILPTLLTLMGITADGIVWGRDVLSLDNADSGFAVIVADEKLGLVQDSLFLFNWVGAGTYLYNVNDTPYLAHDLSDSLVDRLASMEQRLNSYIQLASYLSRGGRIATITP